MRKKNTSAALKMTTKRSANRPIPPLVLLTASEIIDGKLSHLAQTVIVPLSLGEQETWSKCALAENSKSYDWALRMVREELERSSSKSLPFCPLPKDSPEFLYLIMMNEGMDLFSLPRQGGQVIRLGDSPRPLPPDHGGGGGGWSFFGFL